MEVERSPLKRQTETLVKKLAVLAFAASVLMVLAYGLHRGDWLGAVLATVSGFTSFVAHAGSPPYQVYMMPQRLPPQLYAGTATMFFAVTNFIKAISYFSLGQFTTDNIQTSLILMPLAIAATFGGVWLVRRFDKEKFYTLVYAMTFLIGCKLIADSLL